METSRIDGVIVSVLASSVVDCGLQFQSGQNQDNKIGICYFSTNRVSLVQITHRHHLIEK